MSDQIRVVVCGACGRMGMETAKAVAGASDTLLVGVSDTNFGGRNFYEITGVTEGDLTVNADLAALIDEVKPDAVVDFTAPSAAMGNIRTILGKGVSAVVGTTGITSENLKEIEELCANNDTSALVIPNFAVGAVLMMKFAAEAAKHMQTVEIIELHHDKKLDSPSGTALKTAEMINASRQEAGVTPPPAPAGEEARGMDANGVHIHSVRLPGLVAHQEVIFGGLGQTLTIRHDSIDRTSFMPGVLLAVRKSQEMKGLTYGLEKIL